MVHSKAGDLSVAFVHAQQHPLYSMAVKKEFNVKEIIGIEEFSWMLMGLFFGWLAGKGATQMLVAIPIAFFALWTIFYLHRKTVY